MNTYLFTSSLKIKKALTFAVILVFFTPYMIAAESTHPPSEITFLTWEEYISEDIVTQFEQKYNAKINFIYFESDDARNEIVTTMGVSGYDLMLVDSVNMPSYKKLDWITSFDSKRSPNIINTELPAMSHRGDSETSAITSRANLTKHEHTCTPYTWGTTGIAYRKDLLTQPITSWKQVFKPADELQGKILMASTSQEVVGMALKSLGYSMGSSNRQELEQARHLLLTQAPLVAGYSAVAGEAKKSKLVSGEVSAILTYSGDALKLEELEPNIVYVIPEEGGAIWADFVCLSASAGNIELAHDFINFINQPEQAANNALFIYSATPNKAAEKLLPSDFLNNPIIYPEQAQLAQSETYQALSPRTIKKHNLIMSELRKALK